MPGRSSGSRSRWPATASSAALDRHYASIEPVVLDRCDIARFDAAGVGLCASTSTCCASSRPSTREASTRRSRDSCSTELNRFCNVWRPEDRESWAEARAELTPLYAQRNGNHSHEVVAIGHAHIDTAWLWPIAETYRKCVRTFSSQTAYMDAYPEYRFACSQAQQYAWIKERNPDLYERIRQRVARGQFIPVGGTWVEPDCNIPSGESLVRQFLLGQSFFEREFGSRCREFWNPDVFGYNGQLPQIMRGAGIERFLTQKLSWNRFNRPAYHTFLLAGDRRERGADALPAGRHLQRRCATVAEIRRTARDFKDHDRSHTSFLLYGYGDGGGRPTPGDARDAAPRRRPPGGSAHDAALERGVLQRARARRATDWPVLGRRAVLRVPPRARTPRRRRSSGANRRSELLLHDVELLAALAHWRGRGTTRATRSRGLWQMLCCNQFHDIIPGSSITEVYEDAPRDYAEIAASRRGAARVGSRGARRRAPRAVVSAQHGRRLETRGGASHPAEPTCSSRRRPVANGSQSCRRTRPPR